MSSAGVPRLLVVHEDDLGMRFGGDHPADRRRHQLAVALCRESGLLGLDAVALAGAPEPLGDEALARVFAPAFVRAVRRYSRTPPLAAEPESRQWGIALAAGCPEPAHGWLEDRGPEPDADRDRAAAEQSAAAVQLTVAALSRFFPVLG